MKIIGVTGKIGSGKTTVSEMFLRFPHTEIINCDRLASSIIDSNLKIQQKIKEKFGLKSFFEGKLNRPYIRDIVFNDKEKLQALNSIVHAELFIELKKELKKYTSDTNLIVVEAAVMYEAKLFKLVDKVVWVNSSLEIAVNRASKRDHSKKEQIKNIYNSQSDLENLKPNPDFIINNDTDLNSLKNQVEFIYCELKK
jgi:dephospho-CoA kinase